MKKQTEKPADAAQLARDRMWLDGAALTHVYGPKSGRAWQKSPLVNLANMTPVYQRPTQDC